MRRTSFYPFIGAIASLCFGIVAAKQIVVGNKESISETCPEHHYNVHIFSKDPLVIYIPDFITEEEASHLREITYVLPGYRNKKLFRIGSPVPDASIGKPNSPNPKSSMKPATE